MKLNSNIFDIQRNFNEIYKDRHSLRPSALVHCEWNRRAFLLLYLYPSATTRDAVDSWWLTAAFSPLRKFKRILLVIIFLLRLIITIVVLSSSYMPDPHLKSIIIATLLLPPSPQTHRWLYGSASWMYDRLYVVALTSCFVCSLHCSFEMDHRLFHLHNQMKSRASKKTALVQLILMVLEAAQ